MWIDSHSHLYMDAFDADRADMLERAWQAGVEAVIIPAEDLETSRAIVEFCKHDSRLHPACGVHPHEADGFSDTTVQELRKLLALPEVVAVGEIGLDYFRMHTPKDAQITCLETLLELALEIGKPVIIHNRDSGADMLERLAPASKRGLRGVIHCFSGDADFARQCLDLGFYISFAGQVTYPKAQEIRDAAAIVPLDRIMTETDAPYLSPQKKRGKRNEPAYMPYTGELLAQIKEVDTAALAQAAAQNARTLFGI